MNQKLYISLLFLSIQFSMFPMDGSVAHEKQQGFTEEAIIQALEGILLPSAQEGKITDGSSKVQEAAKKLEPLCKAGIVVHEMPGRPCVRFEDKKRNPFWVDYALARANIAEKSGVFAEAKLCTQSAPRAHTQSAADSNWCE